MKELKRSSVIIGVSVWFVMCCFIALIMNGQKKSDAVRMEYIGNSVSSQIYETLLQQFSKTRVLHAYLMETDGKGDFEEDFGDVAEILLDDPGIRSVLTVPGGIVDYVYPLKGNEELVGLDMNSDGPGNKEAQAAIEAGDLYMAGPFPLVEGGEGVAGRLPVFLENDDGKKAYWGLVSVTLSFPEVLENIDLEAINEQGYACQIWRMDPDTGEKQVIMESAVPYAEVGNTITVSREMFHAVWNFTLSPVRSWYLMPIFWILVVLSVVLSALTAFAVFNRKKVYLMQKKEAEQQILSLQEQLDQEHSKMMLNQISKHFFYHTLNALQALIILKPDEAYKMAGDFARYLRYNVDTIISEHGTIDFHEELRAVRAYADINIAQLGDRLKIYYDIPHEDFLIPCLTLQPIVENAIIHGIKPKVGGGEIRITQKEEPDSWIIIVQDTGMGYAVESESGKHSVGIENVCRRLSGFENCYMEVMSNPGEGTMVSIHYAKDLKKVNNLKKI